MFNIKSGVRMLKSNTASNIIAVLVLAFSMIALNFCLNFTGSYSLQIDLLKPFENKKSYKFLKSCSESDEFDINNLTKVKNISNCYENSFVTDNNKGINLCAYDNYLAEFAELKLDKGIWYTKVDKAENQYNAVVVKNQGYNIGDTITVTNPFENVEITLRVTGLLPESFYFLFISSRTGTPASVNYVTKLYKNDGQYKDKILCFCDYRAILNSKKTDVYYIEFDEDISEAELKNNLDYLNIYGQFYSFDEMVEGSRKENKENLQIFVPTIFLLNLLCLIGLIAIAGITVGLNKKMLSMLYYCGAKKHDVMATISTYLGIITIISIAIFSIANVFINAFYASVSYYMPARKNFWISLFSTALVLAVIAITLGINTNKNISKTIKEE